MASERCAQAGVQGAPGFGAILVSVYDTPPAKKVLIDAFPELRLSDSSLANPQAVTGIYNAVVEGNEDWQALKADIEAFLRSSQAKVSGEVVLETRGGRVDAVAVVSPHILNASGATYAQSADWGVEEAEGFIRLFGMSSTLWAEVNRK